MKPPLLDPPLELEPQGEVVRNECRWRGQNADGELVMLAQLLPELAEDESLRRRYVYEAERLASISSAQLARVVAIGPQPDPRSPESVAPWRLRCTPVGTRLDRWLEARAPVPIDEAVALLETLARAVHSVNEAGLVLRDLEPKSIVLNEDGEVTITDVGLARVDILSSRTASSLMLESSAYAAPEHLRATVVDARADVYTLAAIAWEALTGVLPYDEGSPFLRDFSTLPELGELRPGVPDGLGALLRDCLSEHPDGRPSSAEELGHILSGRPGQGRHSLERVLCQACGQTLRLGLRLCLECGSVAVQFEEVSKGLGYTLYLTKAKEDPEFHNKLHRFFVDVGEGPPPELNFLVGDVRMYSKEEQKKRSQLPAPLLRGVTKESADRLAKRLRDDGFSIKVRRGKPPSRAKRLSNFLLLGAGGGGSIAIGTGIAMRFWPAVAIGGGVALFGFITGAIKRHQAKRDATPGLTGLRKGPAALPASDPFVARIAGVLTAELAADLREQVSELALLVQRLCDHRDANADASGAMAMLLAPLEELVGLVCGEVEQVRVIDAELVELEEGTLIRAIAASLARRETRAKRANLLAGLDRLRELEDRRAEHLGALLQAAALLRRTVALGLGETDGRLLESNRITTALATLGRDQPVLP